MALMNLGDAMDLILNAIADGSTLKDACSRAGVSQGAHYHWLSSDNAYQQGYELAIKIRGQLAQDEGARRAFGYDDEEITYEYDEFGTERVKERKVKRKYDSAILQMFIKASDPDKFSNRVKQEITDTSVVDILAAARRRLNATKSNGEES